MENKIEKLGKIIDTDVLILGSGAAGSCAAVAAKRQGSSVLLVDKAKLEASGAVCGGNDHFMANLNTGPEWDTDEAVVKHFVELKEGVPASVYDKHWVKNIPVIVKLLEDSGLEFVRNPDGSYLRTVGFSQPGPWWINIKNGQLIKKLLAKQLRGAGVETLDRVMVTKLLKTGGMVVGAVGFNVKDGSFYILRGKTVILALGTEASRVTYNSSLNPFNSFTYPYNTGSNLVMAYEAGAKIRNIELMAAATLIPKGFGCPGMNGINSMGGHELNAFGERFMGKYEPEFWENCIRRKQVAATQQELTQGKGPPFFEDMRHLSKEDNDLLQNVLMPGDKATFLDYIRQKGLTFAKDMMEVELSEIYIGARIVINAELESSVKNLYSGCNFSFLSGAMCGGYGAGLEAAKAAREMREPGSLNLDEINQEKERIFRPLNKQSGYSPREFENLIRQVMNYYMGYIRNQKGIELALEKLNLIANYIGDIKASNYHELMRANESRHLLTTCKLHTRAAIERKESGRTLYRRSDYPDINPELSRCLVLWQEDGEPKIAFESPL
jgi:succinate dehydrogenase/fumarate reductase flavoprotein subunit